MSVKLVQVTLDDHSVDCLLGLPLTELLAKRSSAWRASPRLHQPRGMFCGMGLCFECAIEVDGHWSRACLERAREGMVIRTGLRLERRE